MRINRIWMRLNYLGALVLLVTLIYGLATKDIAPLRVGLVVWFATYFLRLTGNKCKRCGQNYMARSWKDAGDGYKICPKCGTRHQII